MESITILTLVREFGLPLVLLILVVVWIKPKLDKIVDLVIKQAGGQPESLNMIIDFDAQINALLKEGLLLVDANWCQLWQFHNGLYGIGKTRCPFLRVSITHEQTSDDTKSMAQHIQNVPTAIFSSAIKQLLERDRVIHITSDPSRTSPVGEMMHDFGGQVGYLFAVHDSERSIVAILGVGFNKLLELTEEEQTLLSQIAVQVGIKMSELHQLREITSRRIKEK